MMGVGTKMILERKMQLNIPDLKEQAGKFQDNFLIAGFEGPNAGIMELAGLIQIYNGAMKEVSTKLEILDDEFHIRNSYNPIHHLECRIKGVRSIYEKLRKRNAQPTIESVKGNVQDIAGIRVICNFIDDIYAIEKLLLKQADVELIKRKDYIANPKESGYRSLHLVVSIPVFLSDKEEYVPVEIQMRTIAMDYWASLEHMLRYKSNSDMSGYSVKLLDCANSLAETEMVMQEIRNSVEKGGANEPAKNSGGPKI
ncbi:MAG: GTP pyrophosphokinase family protein [Clostridiales bacterium]|jgi:putative GTP pyrophosphokinase|nr:GTP pyrophosphokinase family protein [Clostridiales bacterium]